VFCLYRYPPHSFASLLLRQAKAALSLRRDAAVNPSSPSLFPSHVLGHACFSSLFLLSHLCLPLCDEETKTSCST
jgi:hypothetical protein